MSKLIEISLALLWICLLAGCESSRSVTTTSPEKQPRDPVTTETPESGEDQVAAGAVEAMAVEEPAPADPETVAHREEAEKKYRLATQLLEFSGPIDDLSSESKNVRWLAAGLFETAIGLNPGEFKYYRDLFMTYMVLQEPVRAIEVIETASREPVLEEEVAEFRTLVFGALEFASLIEEES